MKSKLTIFLIFFALISAPSDAAEFVTNVRLELAPGITLMMRASRFVPSKHSLRKVKGHVIIDGHQVMGVDGGIPRTQLDEAYVLTRGHKIRLETASLYNPWFGAAPSKDSFEVSWHEDEPQKEAPGLYY